MEGITQTPFGLGHISVTYSASLHDVPIERQGRSRYGIALRAHPLFYWHIRSFALRTHSRGIVERVRVLMLCVCRAWKTQVCRRAGLPP